MLPMKVISAATRLPPRLYGMEMELGPLEPGRLADIIVVDGNPLESMLHLSKVARVVRGGGLVC